MLAFFIGIGGKAASPDEGVAVAEVTAWRIPHEITKQEFFWLKNGLEFF